VLYDIYDDIADVTHMTTSDVVALKAKFMSHVVVVV